IHPIGLTRTSSAAAVAKSGGNKSSRGRLQRLVRPSAINCPKTDQNESRRHRHGNPRNRQYVACRSVEEARATSRRQFRSCLIAKAPELETLLLDSQNSQDPAQARNTECCNRQDGHNKDSFRREKKR